MKKIWGCAEEFKIFVETIIDGLSFMKQSIDGDCATVDGCERIEKSLWLMVDGCSRFGKEVLDLKTRRSDTMVDGCGRIEESFTI